MSITSYVYDSLENVHYSVVKKKVVSYIVKKGYDKENEIFYVKNDVGLKKDEGLYYEKEFFEQYRQELETNKGFVMKMKRSYMDTDIVGFEVLGDRWYLREEQQKKWDKIGILYGYNLNKKNKGVFNELQLLAYNYKVGDSFLGIDGKLLFKVKGLGYVVRSCDSLFVLPYKESLINYIFLVKKYWYIYAMENIGFFMKDYGVVIKKIENLLLVEKDKKILEYSYYNLVWFLINISWLLSLYQILYKKAKKKNKIVIKSLIYGYTYIERLVSYLGKLIVLEKKKEINIEDTFLKTILSSLDYKKKNNNIGILQVLLNNGVKENSVEDFVLLQYLLMISILNLSNKKLVVQPEQDGNRYILQGWVEGNRKLNVISRKLLKIKMLEDNKQLFGLGKKKEKKKEKERRKNAAIR